MRADLVIDGELRIYGVAHLKDRGIVPTGSVDAVIGREIRVVLVDAMPGPIRWSADNDEVLRIADDSGPEATITPEAQGISTLDLVQRGRIIASIRFSVFPPQAARLAGLTGEPLQK